MIEFVVPSRIELEYQVPETCVLSIVLRDQDDKTTGKNFGKTHVSNCNCVFLDVNFLSSQSEKITQASAKQKPAITSDA